MSRRSPDGEEEGLVSWPSRGIDEYSPTCSPYSPTWSPGYSPTRSPPFRSPASTSNRSPDGDVPALECDSPLTIAPRLSLRMSPLFVVLSVAPQLQPQPGPTCSNAESVNADSVMCNTNASTEDPSPKPLVSRPPVVETATLEGNLERDSPPKGVVDNLVTPPARTSRKRECVKFTCVECRKQFTRFACDLKNPILRCRSCQSAVVNQNQRVSESRYRGDGESFGCTVSGCPINLASYNSLLDHLVKHERCPFTCRTCGRLFEEETAHRQHAKLPCKLRSARRRATIPRERLESESLRVVIIISDSDSDDPSAAAKPPRVNLKPPSPLPEQNSNNKQACKRKNKNNREHPVSRKRQRHASGKGGPGPPQKAATGAYYHVEVLQYSRLRVKLRSLRYHPRSVPAVVATQTVRGAANRPPQVAPANPELALAPAANVEVRDGHSGPRKRAGRGVAVDRLIAVKHDQRTLWEVYHDLSSSLSEIVLEYLSFFGAPLPATPREPSAKNATPVFAMLHGEVVVDIKEDFVPLWRRLDRLFVSLLVVLDNPAAPKAVTTTLVLQSSPSTTLAAGVSPAHLLKAKHHLVVDQLLGLINVLQSQSDAFLASAVHSSFADQDGPEVSLESRV